MATGQDRVENGEPSKTTANRRQWPRKPSDLSEITVVCGAHSHVASVVDESLGGIGIKMAEISDIVRGDQLKLLYHRVPVLGVVRRVQAEHDGHRVGLEWLNTGRNELFEKRPNALRRTAEFLSFSGFYVSCRISEGKNEGRTTVHLPDGSRCEVKSSDLITRTIAERKAELVELSLDLNMLAGVYQLGMHDSKDARIEAIIGFEFEQQVETVADLQTQIRTKNKTILAQAQRIEELESYLGCIIGLAAKVRELELELDTTA